MTTEHAIDRLDAAIEVVNEALGHDVMLGAMVSIWQRYELCIWCADCIAFSVSIEEIRRYTDLQLVNLVKTRLTGVLFDLAHTVQNLGIYCHILHGTQPWVLVQGL